MTVRDIRPPVEPAVVEMLEALLTKARAGEIVGLCAVTFERSGERRWHAGQWTRHAALWAFEHMKHRLLFGEDGG